MTKIYLSIILPIILGFGLAISALCGLALAQEGDTIVMVSVPATPEPTNLSALPFIYYARVLVSETIVYSNPIRRTEQVTPLRTLGTGYLWVSLTNSHPISVDNQAWYMINKNEYVPMEHLAIYTPSTFQGITVTSQPTMPFGWLVYYVRPSITPGIVTTQTPYLYRYQLITISAVTKITTTNWYQVGENQWVEEHNVGLVKVMTRPIAVQPNEKWVEVNLFEQTMSAYEGDKLVYATLVSSGMPLWPTLKGLYRISAKVKLGKMTGGDKIDYYFLEDVPWAMYYYGGYSLHGAYWHDGFGFPRSHGCVNLSLRDAKWLFDWSAPKPNRGNWTGSTAKELGTWVWVH